MAQPTYLSEISSEFQPELTDIQRKQKLAELLMQRGMTQPQGQMVGGRFVAPSITERLAGLFNIYSGRNLQETTEERQKALAEKLRQAEASDLQKFMEAGRSAPEQTIYGAGVEGPTMTVTPEVKPDYRKQLAIALSSQSPTVRALGTEMLKQSMTPIKVGSDESLVVRDFLGGTGGITPIATGAPKLGQELRDAARQARLDITKVDQWTDADWARVRKIEADIAAGKRPVTNVMVNTAKDISAQVGDIAKESKIQATGAVQTADAANRIIQAVDSKNLISGPGAGVRLKGAQIAEVLGLGGDTTSDKISNSRQAVQGLAQLTLQGRKQMRGEGAITESESKLAERAMSGDLDFTASEIRQLAEAAKRSAKFTYSQHQNIIKTMQNNPDAKSLVPYFDVPVDIDIFNARPVGGQSATRTKADQILQGKP